MKRILFTLLSFILVLSLVGCGGNESSTSTETETETTEEKVVIGFVTDTGGLGDQAFNDAVHSGLLKATEEFNYELKIIESKEIGDYADNMRTLLNEGASVIVVAGAPFADSVSQVAAEYPDKYFLSFDSEVDGMDNVSSTLSKEQEAAYVLGAFAGLVSETGIAGYVAGVESPLQERAINGFKAGFLSTRPDGKVIDIYAGTYNDVGKGKEIASTLYDQGADYVATFAGACNLGVFQAATEAGEGKYALGAALGQFDKNPEKIIASQVKTIDLAVYNALAEFSKGEFSSGIVVRGIKEGGVDILYNPDAELVSSIASEEVLNKVEEIRQQVIDGKIDIPETREELEALN